MKSDEKEKTEKKKNGKQTRKGSRIDLLYGMLKGKIFCDDAVFNLGVKA
jgi:hypothetical protein